MILFILLMISLFTMAEFKDPEMETPFLTKALSYPSCFKEGISWSSAESIDIITGIHSLYSCQELCLKSTNCHQFSWYNVYATPLNFLCFLYDHPTLEYSCSNCVSGPESCTCSDFFSCEVSDENFIGEVSLVELEVFCQDYCVKTDNCAFYTWFTEDFHPFPNSCFMFSSCTEKDFTCKTCRSGPPDCTNIAIITSTTATSTTITTTCDLPEAQKHGDWFCPGSHDAATCHLECHPGYVSTNGTVISCQHGEWTSAPTCVAAVAIITGSAEGLDNPSYNTVELYGEDLHEKLSNLPDFRERHSLELVDSVLLLCGGYFNPTSCIVFTASQQWTSHSTTISPRIKHSSVSMLGKLHLLGGAASSSEFTTEYLTPPMQNWEKGWCLFETTEQACAAKIDPEVLIITGSHSSSVVSYNVTSGVATRLQDLITPRYNHGCVYVRDLDTGFRGVLVAGGYYRGELEDSEIYDVKTGEWETTGQLTSKRWGVRMAMLGSNILAFGGFDGSYYLNTVDRFNLTSRNWTATEEMLETRGFHALTGVPPSAVGMEQN